MPSPPRPASPPAPGSARRFKDNHYAQLARVGKAVASPRRIELLDLLGQAPRTVEDLAAQAGMSLASCSQHLQVLRGARLVEAHKAGLYVTYRLAPGVEAFLLAQRRLAQERLPDLEANTRAFLESRNALEPVDRATLLRRALSGEVTVLDVRPPEEFHAGHLPGARSVPLHALRARLCELPRDQEIVAYCRGATCVFAIEAVRALREAGFTAWRLDSGPADWRAAGVRLAEGP